MTDWPQTKVIRQKDKSIHEAPAVIDLTRDQEHRVERTSLREYSYPIDWHDGLAIYLVVRDLPGTAIKG